jgi:hypothetical protein
MKPTARLRFKEIPVGNEHPAISRKILQQWWTLDIPEYMSSGDGEWRDVPLVAAE